MIGNLKILFIVINYVTHHIYVNKFICIFTKKIDINYYSDI